MLAVVVSGYFHYQLFFNISLFYLFSKFSTMRKKFSCHRQFIRQNSIIGKQYLQEGKRELVL